MASQTLTVRTKKLGVLIYDARLARRRTAEECANAIGVSPDAFRDFEAGKSSPSLPQLEVLAFYLEIPLEHFWGSDSLSEKKPAAIDTARLLALRQRMIGAMLRQYRNNANVSTQDLAGRGNISEDDLRAYELGEKSLPLPLLESLLQQTGSQMSDFIDKNGPVGSWIKGQNAVEKFLDLPENLRQFISTPVNRPFIEVALRLSELPTDRLRAIAEGLLEITY